MPFVGGGKEVAPPGEGGGEGGDRNRYHSLKEPLLPGHLLQVPWEILLGVGQRLSGGGAQPLEITTEVGVAV